MAYGNTLLLFAPGCVLTPKLLAPLACFLYYLKRKNPLFKFEQIDGPALPRKLKEVNKWRCHSSMKRFNHSKVFTILLLAISYCPDNQEFITKMQTLKIETQQVIEKLIKEVRTLRYRTLN